MNSAKEGFLFPPGMTENERNNIQSCRYQKDKKIPADISSKKIKLLIIM